MTRTPMEPGGHLSIVRGNYRGDVFSPARDLDAARRTALELCWRSFRIEAVYAMDEGRNAAARLYAFNARLLVEAFGVRVR